MATATPTISALALEIAQAEQLAGVYEDPPRSNRGPRIDEYQKGRGNLGQAWCLKFVHWCYGQAATRLGMANPLPKLYAVNAFLEWAKKEGKVVVEPQIGDVIVKKPAKHVGLLLTLPVASSFSSIEGNTWAADPNKEGVYLVKRLHVVNYEFVRVAP